jgi:hypothetical protein
MRLGTKDFKITNAEREISESTAASIKVKHMGWCAE